nr:MAG TPA: putative cytosolic protein [Caudoviricetes sp.]
MVFRTCVICQGSQPGSISLRHGLPFRTCVICQGSQPSNCISQVTQVLASDYF